MSKVITNDGVALHYVERGDGQPLLIVPGWGMSVRWFSGQLEDLSDRMRVIVFDPRGQGDSDKVSRGQRMARLARDIEDVIVGLELEDVVLVGGRSASRASSPTSTCSAPADSPRSCWSTAARS